MGDTSQNDRQLAEEQYRISTYGSRDFPLDKHALAKSGFYYTQKGNLVKCFRCNLEVDAANVSSAEIDQCHKDRFPRCFGVTDNPQNRSKKFISYDSLRFEKERLETFIEWPVTWLMPLDLARDGFYYLRTADHCACVFCRGIVGAWEKGDTPRGEHQRHFPHCPFVKGQPVGNIPLEHSRIISRLSPRSETNRTPSFPNVDVCGTPRLMSGSYAEKTGPPNKDCMNLEGMGLPVHSGPKRRDYLTNESRLASYVRWPELVKQKPAELAEAGFFYCGLSDHVRCFHCGNGLRNWEADDQPWDEHARWYPECNFVLLKKGQEFVDQVRRERPPYIRSQPSTKSGASNVLSIATASVRPAVSDSELDPLMELDIIRAVLSMGFPTDKVRAALRRKLEQTGLPFFSLEPCIEAVLQYMEEETRQTLHQRSSQDIDDEATEQQAAKMEILQPRNHSPREADEIGVETASVSSQPSTSAAAANAAPVSQSEATNAASHSHTALPASSNSSPSVSSSIVSPPSSLSSPEQVSMVPSSASSSGPSSTTSPVSSLSSPEISASTTTTGMAQQSPASPHEAMDVDDPPSAQTLTEPIDIITQANEIIVMAKRALKPPSSGPSSLEEIEGKIEGPAACELLEDSPSTSGVKKLLRSVGDQSSKELAEELERIRDIRMCKVCMDGEMDVVFLPCAHMVTCASCALALAQCPICRVDIKYTIKPILS